jgi:uncharacterized membrane-anchored protein
MSPRRLLFGLLCLAQLGVAASGIAIHERTLTQGAGVLLAVAPVDPEDPFRGRYVSLAFELEQGSHALRGPQPHYSDPAFVVLKVDAAHVATVDYVTATEPKAGLYLKAESSWQEGAGVRVSLPLKRYYMNEQLAPAAERAYRAAIQAPDRKSYARVRVLGGRSVIEAVLLDGVPIEQAARAHN